LAQFLAQDKIPLASAPQSLGLADCIETKRNIAMSSYLTVTVPVTVKDGKTRFRRVGAAFQNRDGAKAAFSIKLDFPVGATEFALFEPRDHNDEDPVTE
jgi:hypothetical protein